MNVKNNPLILCILDGWGIGSNDKYNAIHVANTPTYDQLISNYPSSKLIASEEGVGLPEGQIGNSEIGHMTIGAGRNILQTLPRINAELSNLEANKDILNLIDNQKLNNNTCHLVGLLSDGGVHSHQNHIIFIAKLLAKYEIEVKLHIILDGRDVGQKTAKEYILNLKKEIKDNKNIIISTVSGRYYAMDRDNNWKRIELYYDVIARSKGKKYKDIYDLIEDSYKKNITDEFIVPSIIEDNYQGMNNGDSIIMANFRADRVRQIATALVDPNFIEFDVKKISFTDKISITSYSANLNKYLAVLFSPIKIKNSLGEILQNHGLRQLRIAETEKYAHVTYFFSGGKEEKFEKEDRILINSKKVATYDLLPEMSANEITKKLIDSIDNYDVIIVNYANADMVGHSGNLNSSIEACNVIDKQLSDLYKIIKKKNGILIITSDHGNIENMRDKNKNPHTSHTVNKVPFILVNEKLKNIKLKDGKLSDITPTILNLLKIPIDKEIEGNILIED